MEHTWPIGPGASASMVSEVDIQSALETSDSLPVRPVGIATVDAGPNLPPNRKISGAKTMWQFFARYTLTGQAS